uniref:CDAN1-interacting nuclease 1 n=1 Tax=Timema shepardi TaxID=629360 RepID=A0A7R9ARX4_TIMSH|nr:unnamed protein product [Timema shepardi]
MSGRKRVTCNLRGGQATRRSKNPPEAPIPMIGFRIGSSHGVALVNTGANASFINTEFLGIIRSGKPTGDIEINRGILDIDTAHLSFGFNARVMVPLLLSSYPMWLNHMGTDEDRINRLICKNSDVITPVWGRCDVLPYNIVVTDDIPPLLAGDEKVSHRDRRQEAFECLKMAHRKVADRYNRERVPVSVTVGDSVLCKCYPKSSTINKISAKLSPKWSDLWRVERFLTPVTILLCDVDDPSTTRLAHVSQVKTTGVKESCPIQGLLYVYQGRRPLDPCVKIIDHPSIGARQRLFLLGADKIMEESNARHRDYLKDKHEYLQAIEKGETKILLQMSVDLRIAPALLARLILEQHYMPESSKSIPTHRTPNSRTFIPKSKPYQTPKQIYSHQKNDTAIKSSDYTPSTSQRPVQSSKISTSSDDVEEISRDELKDSDDIMAKALQLREKAKNKNTHLEPPAIQSISKPARRVFPTPVEEKWTKTTEEEKHTLKKAREDLLQDLKSFISSKMKEEPKQSDVKETAVPVTKRYITRLMKDTSLIKDKDLAYEVLMCVLYDDQYGPVADAYKHSLGYDYETKLYQLAKEADISCRSEDYMRVNGFDKTPDLLLSKPIAIGQHVVNWVESKALFADEELHEIYFSEQYDRYRNRSYDSALRYIIWSGNFSKLSVSIKVAVGLLYMQKAREYTNRMVTVKESPIQSRNNLTVTYWSPPSIMKD